MQPTAFEASDNCHGLWSATSGLVWNTLRTNLSKFSCAFSDFPHPDETSLFPKANEIASYLERYSHRFGLDRHIRFGHRVTAIKQTKSGWLIQWQNGDSEGSQHFDRVIIASGFFATPIIPKGVKLSKAVTHSTTYRSPEEFADANVLVVGSAFSGADIAAEVATKANKVTVLVRRPSWFLPRMLRRTDGSNIPLDLEFYHRTEDTEATDDAKAAHEQYAYLSALVGNQSELGPLLELSNNGKCHPVVITESFVPAIRSGKIEIIGAKGIDLAQECKNAGRNGKFDRVILATGIGPDLSFLPDHVLTDCEFDPTDNLQPLILARSVFPAAHDSLAFAGMYRGPFFGTIELQSRWACGVLSGNIAAMAGSAMKAALESERLIRAKSPRPQFPHPDYVAMCDKIAASIGTTPVVAPDDHLRQDIENGPIIPAHYRLSGPHAAPDVTRKEIERVKAYLQELNDNNRD